MADTDLSDYAEDVYYGGNYSIMWFEAGDSLIKAGLIVMKDAKANEVLINATDGKGFGIAGKSPFIDLNTLITEGQSVPVYPFGCGAIVWTKHDAQSESLTRGALMQSSSSLAGQSRLVPDYVPKGASYSQGEFSERGDTIRFMIGRCAEDVATGGNNIYYRAILGL